MDDEAALVPTSSNAIVPHSSSDDPPSPVVFELGQLPPELRAKVIIASADGDLEAVRRLSLVHPELNPLLTRFRWKSIELSSRRPDATPRDNLERMASFAESMSPVYGSLVQEVYLGDDRPTGAPLLEDGRGRLLAQILIDLPNINSLRLTGSQHLHTISMSPHLSSLTSLHIASGVVSTALVALISQSHNLTNIDLYRLTSHPDERPPLITALASRQLLDFLQVEWCDFVDETFVTADWQCPLGGLTIKVERLEFSLPIFRTFLSSFSLTLDYLALNVRTDHWFRQRASLTPFPLPRLDDLHLHKCILDRTVPLLELFALSPLKVVLLERFIPDEIDETSLMPDETSLEALARFIRVHHQVHHTLTSVDTLVGQDDFSHHADPQPIAKLIEEARVLGIALEIEN